MSSSLASEERQKIININRSLRTIKNELESLSERGAISDDAYDSIMSALPSESPLNGSSNRGNTNSSSQKSSATQPTPSPVVDPVQAMDNLNLNNDRAPLPTAVPTSTPASTPVSPPLAAPGSAPARTEIARALAHHDYYSPSDCIFSAGDFISVCEFMNQDWGYGKNLRTGHEGLFPLNHVDILPNPAFGPYTNEKANPYMNNFPPPYQNQPAQMQPVQTQPPNPGPSNPYNSSVPPMQVAEQPTDSKLGKGGEMGKKLGKKLGNAAIFGAGATFGGNIVNSIF